VATRAVSVSVRRRLDDSRARSEPGRKPRNGWSGRGLTVAHRPRALLLFFCAAAAVGCGAAGEHEPAPIPTPIGRGPEFVPPRVGTGPPPASACTPGALPGRIRVHLELFAHRRVVVIPARIGVRSSCRYPLRTLTPTGVVELDRGGATLGDFFAVWRMPVSRRRLLTFRGDVTAYVGGKRWDSDVRAIPLFDRAQIVLEVGGYIRPHRFYLFPPR
jgi:hypothetical protein